MTTPGLATISLAVLDAVTGGKPEFSYIDDWADWFDGRGRRPLRRRSDDFSPVTGEPRWDPL
jgi:hypothetical protein